MCLSVCIWLPLFVFVCVLGYVHEGIYVLSMFVSVRSFVCTHVIVCLNVLVCVFVFINLFIRTNLILSFSSIIYLSCKCNYHLIDIFVNYNGLSTLNNMKISVSIQYFIHICKERLLVQFISSHFPLFLWYWLFSPQRAQTQDLLRKLASAEEEKVSKILVVYESVWCCSKQRKRKKRERK